MQDEMVKRKATRRNHNSMRPFSAKIIIDKLLYL